MKRLLIQAAVIIWAIAATAAVVGAGSLAGTVTEEKQEQTKLEREFADLEEEHAALEHWVAKELRPWLIHTAYRQAAALPSNVPTPSLAPLPPVPTVVPPSPPSPVPTPDPLPTPSIDPPTPSDVPSPSLCIPLICIEESPSVAIG